MKFKILTLCIVHNWNFSIRTYASSGSVVRSGLLIFTETKVAVVVRIAFDDMTGVA